MDIFNGESFYEAYLTFKNTLPIGEKFDFFGIGDANFMMNSGSYFVIQAAILGYIIALWMVNKACVCGAKNKTVRQIGIFVHSKNYVHDFISASFKLFLESYFDIVICTMINLVAFKRSKNL